MIAKPPFPRLNHAHPLAQGLVAAWLFYEGSGATINDLGGRRLSGTTQNSVAWVGGRSGWALSSPNSNTGVSVPYNAALDLTEFTICSRFRLVGFNGLAQPSLVLKQSGTATNRNYVMYINSVNSNSLTVSSSFSGVQRDRSSGIDVATVSAWHDGVYTVRKSGSNSIQSVYVDGVLGASGSVSGSPNTQTSPVSIGNTVAFTAGANWQLDDFQIFNRALSAEEISLRYHDPYAAFRDSHLLMRHPFRPWFQSPQQVIGAA